MNRFGQCKEGYLQLKETKHVDIDRGIRNIDKKLTMPIEDPAVSEDNQLMDLWGLWCI